MNGIKLMLECSTNYNEQNFRNVWTCNHHIGAVLVFCPDGAIPICCYNVSGTVRASKLLQLEKFIINKRKSIIELEHTALSIQ